MGRTFLSAAVDFKFLAQNEIKIGGQECPPHMAIASPLLSWLRLEWRMA